jgi:hypothetical protein
MQSLIRVSLRIRLLLLGINASVQNKTPSSTYENGVKSGILITLYYGWKSTAPDASDSPILLLADTLNHPLVDAGTP